MTTPPTVEALDERVRIAIIAMEQWAPVEAAS
jgi:hypothetical protein